jgi:hypothetical protein
MKTTLKTLTAALALAIGASFASAASAETFASGASFKATPVQYSGRSDRGRDYDGGRDYSRGRDYDRDGISNRYDRDRDNDGVRNRYDRNDYSGRGFYRSGRRTSWDWDGDGVPNRRDARPRNPWRS